MSNPKRFPILHASTGSRPKAPLPEARMVALRIQAATALERAFTFVKKKGNPASRVRVQVLLGVSTVDEALTNLATRAREDGSFDPTGQVFAASIEAILVDAGIEPEILGTLEALSLLTDWKRLYSTQAEQTIEFLRATQQDDGAWGDESGADPGSIARIFTAGMLAGFMGRTRFARPEMLAAAGGYLAPRWNVAKIGREGWPLLASFAHYYTNVHDDNAEAALPWCGRELLRGHRASEYDTVETLRLLLYCDADVLPGADFEVAELLDSLLREQAADGGFAASIQAPSERVAPTLDGMLGLLRLCKG